MLLHSRGSIFISLSKEIFLFWKTMKLLLTFSGAEKEAKRHPPPPSRPLYWADVTQEIAETVDFLPCRKAGTRLEIFIGWRMEKEL